MGKSQAVLATPPGAPVPCRAKFTGCRLIVNSKTLTPREAYQILRDIAQGIRPMRRIGEQRWLEIQSGLMTVEVDGWVFTLHKEEDALAHCERCYDPDGAAYIYDAAHPYGTNPVEFMSQWEMQQVQRMLGAL